MRCVCGLCDETVKPGRRYAHGHNRKLPPRYTVDSATGCWLWDGHILASGYGQYKDRGRTFQAHRWFWERVHGSVPAGLELDHLCRVRACVNPAHLEAVTHTENCRRASYARLTLEDVKAIHNLAAADGRNGGAMYREIADRFGVDRRTISKVLSRENWPEVGLP